MLPSGRSGSCLPRPKRLGRRRLQRATHRERRTTPRRRVGSATVVWPAAENTRGVPLANQRNVAVVLGSDPAFVDKLRFNELLMATGNLCRTGWGDPAGVGVNGGRRRHSAGHLAARAGSAIEPAHGCRSGPGSRPCMPLPSGAPLPGRPDLDGEQRIDSWLESMVSHRRTSRICARRAEGGRSVQWRGSCGLGAKSTICCC